MTVRRAIATIVVCTLLAAMLGAATGWGLGRVVPQYHRTVLDHRQDPNFQPVSAGATLGLIQGTGAGAAIGLALVALLTWREIRLQSRPSPLAMTAGRGLGWSLIASLIGLGGVFCFGAGVVVGVFHGHATADYWEQANELEDIQLVLQTDPAFAHVRSDDPVAHGNLLGEVATTADRERLQAVLVKAVGERRARLLVADVVVKP